MVRIAAILLLFFVVGCVEEDDGSKIDANYLEASSSSLVITPSPGAFGNVTVGSSKNLSFTLAASSKLDGLGEGTPQLVAPFSFAGGSYPGAGGTCSKGLKKNESCQVVVRFTPTSVGTFSGALAIKFKGDRNITYTNLVALTGTGAPLPISVSFQQASPYSFQDRALNSSTPKVLTLQNTGQGTALLSVFQQPTAPFSFLGGTYPGTGGTCSTSLVKNATCTIVMAFTPTQAGSFSGTFRISAATGVVLVPGVDSLLLFNLTGKGVTAQTAGSTDTTFGTSGVATVDSGSQSEMMISMQVFSNEKLFVGGVAHSGNSNDFIASVQNLSGVADSTFNTTGFLTVDLNSNSNDVVQAALATSNGKIVLAGYSDAQFAAVRINSTGVLDTSFNGNGKHLVNLGGDSFAYHAALDASDGLYLVGTTNVNGFYQMGIVKLTNTGVLDTSFNGTGKLILTVGLDHSMAFGAQVQADGKLVLVGFGLDVNSYDLAVVRLNPNGTLDTSFSGDGIQFVNHGGQEKGTSLLIQNDGKIVVAGRSIQNGSSNYAVNLARLNSDGSLDTSFATAGKYRGSFLYSESANAVIARSGSGDYYMAWTCYRQNTPAQNNVKVTKFNSSGQIISTFGTGGTLTLTSLISKLDQNPAISVVNDGRVVVGGTTVDTANLASTKLW